MTIEKRKLSDDYLDIAGGKDKIKVASWDYVCHRCGYDWTKYNGLFKKEINPTKYVKCPKCGEEVRSFKGNYSSGGEATATELAMSKKCPWK